MCTPLPAPYVRAKHMQRIANGTNMDITGQKDQGRLCHGGVTEVTDGGTERDGTRDFGIISVIEMLSL